MRNSPPARERSGATGRAVAFVAAVLAAGVALLLIGAVTDTAPGDASGRLEPLDCDEVRDEGVNDGTDSWGAPIRFHRHACVVDGTPVAFHFDFIIEAGTHPVGEVDDPDGGALAVSGEGWRMHLVGEAVDTTEVAAAIAAHTDGDVGRLLSPFICRIRHPDGASA
ncbi:MAG: hypothetical protein AAGD18_24365 [Actinomycetota bacterium]